MKSNVVPSQRAQTRSCAARKPKRSPKPIVLSTLLDRATLSIREFAAKFGHHETWGYRKIYSGEVDVIDVMGHLMIPTSEVDRLLALAKPYDPKPRKPKLIEENGGEG